MSPELGVWRTDGQHRTVRTDEVHVQRQIRHIDIAANVIVVVFSFACYFPVEKPQFINIKVKSYEWASDLLEGAHENLRDD